MAGFLRRLLGDRERRGIIYGAYCSQLNKVYVGKTLRSLADRKYQHEYWARNAVDIERGMHSALYKAMRQLGPEQFKWGVLEYHVRESLLSERENYWIEILHAIEPQGFNRTTRAKKWITPRSEGIAKIISCREVRFTKPDVIQGN